MMSDMKKITVVIPNLNGMEYLDGCLSSLREQTEQSFDTILIDNGSGDGSVEFVRSHFPEVKVRSYRRNTGFCHAVNDGILLARTPYVFLLNNDTVLEPDVLRRLLLAMDRGGEKLFSCSARLVSLHDPEKMDDAGDFFCIFGWAFARGKGKSSSLYGEEEDIFASCAAAALYRREVFDRIGLFDERHFAYLEDIDVGFRARTNGYISRYVPSATVYHAGSATSGSRYNEFKVRQAAGNNLYMICKNMPLWQLVLNFPLFTAGCAVKAVYFAHMGLLRPYLQGLLKGLSMTRGLSFGRGPVWPASICRKREKAGMSELPSQNGSFKGHALVQADMIRGLIPLLETWR